MISRLIIVYCSEKELIKTLGIISQLINKDIHEGKRLRKNTG